MKNKNLYAGVAAGFVSGKVVKSFAYSLVPVAAIGYVGHARARDSGQARLREVCSDDRGMAPCLVIPHF